jgi:hypothetical protein
MTVILLVVLPIVIMMNPGSPWSRRSPVSTRVPTRSRLECPVCAARGLFPNPSARVHSFIIGKSATTSVDWYANPQVETVALTLLNNDNNSNTNSNNTTGDSIQAGGDSGSNNNNNVVDDKNSRKRVILTIVGHFYPRNGLRYSFKWVWERAVMVHFPSRN